MKRHHVSALLVIGLAVAITLSGGCQGKGNFPIAVKVGTSAQVFAARVSDLGSNRGRLLPFSTSGTRRIETPKAEAATIDPLRKTNDELACVLGTNNDLVQALAKRNNLQPLPFAIAPQPAKPEFAPDVVEDSRPIQPKAPAVPTSVLIEKKETQKVVKNETKKAASKPKTAAGDLPSEQPLIANRKEDEVRKTPTDAPKTSVKAETQKVETQKVETQKIEAQKVETKEELVSEVPDTKAEDLRIRDERIQKLLDLLAKAEARAAENISKVPSAPIIERPLEAVPEKAEPLVIPQVPQAPKEIVLRAVANVPYQSVRSERVELLNVQQMAPTVPARPRVPAVVVNPPMQTEGLPGWANSDWSKGLVPDFSALGASAPEKVEFAPLPPTSDALKDSPTVESEPVTGGESSLGKTEPELDTNPATAARPIQKAQERR